MENRKTEAKIKKPKSLFFEKIKNISNPLAKLPR